MQIAANVRSLECFRTHNIETMRIGANTLIWTAGFGREHIPLLAEIKEHGFDLVELARFDWTDYPAAEIRRALEKLDLGVSYCTAFGSPDKSLVHEDAAARRAGIDFMKQAIENTAATGGQMLAGPFTRRSVICRGGGARRMNGRGKSRR